MIARPSDIEAQHYKLLLATHLHVYDDRESLTSGLNPPTASASITKLVSSFTSTSAWTSVTCIFHQPLFFNRLEYEMTNSARSNGQMASDLSLSKSIEHHDEAVPIRPFDRSCTGRCEPVDGMSASSWGYIGVASASGMLLA